jgi:hypothetical protein
MADDNLSDLTNDGSNHFNSPLSDEEVKSRIDNKKDVKDRDSSRFDTKSNRSMFDKNAVIDYGRYVRSAFWQEFRTDRTDGGYFDPKNTQDGGDNFITNEPRKRQYNAPVIDEDFEEELTIPNIIRWSEKYPALQLKFQDFVYAKRMDHYPMNRLVVLRRFKNGVPDNLFDYYNRGEIEDSQPISTMVTWLKYNDDIMDSFSFNEVWSSEENDGMMELLKHVSSEMISPFVPAKIASAAGGLANIVDSFILPNILSGVNVKRVDGLDFMDNEIGGDPNFINKAQHRAVSGGGLSSTIGLRLTFEYELRYIPDVDPSIAMLDLLANCFRMGTSVSRFRYPVAALKESDIINKAINNEFVFNFEAFVTKIKEITGKMLDNVNTFIKDQKRKSADELTKSATKTFDKNINFVISRYRERMKSAFAADTGLPSGIWHVSIGNPKKPFISCGDLVIESGSIKLGKELGYNDFPTSFSCTIELKSARQRGRDELERIFNAGRGRVYIYAKPNQNIDNYLPSKSTPK